MSSYPWFTSSNPRVQILELSFQLYELEFISASYEFNSTSYDLKSISYELKSTSYEFRSELQVEIHEFKNHLINETRVNNLKIFLFPKILNLKWFSNLWGNSYVPFLVKISCFTFPLFHSYGFSSKQRYLTFAKKSHPSPYDFGETFCI